MRIKNREDNVPDTGSFERFKTQLRWRKRSFSYGRKIIRRDRRSREIAKGFLLVFSIDQIGDKIDVG